MYRTIARIIPASLRRKIVSLLSFSTIRIEPQSFIGFVSISTVLIGILLGFLLGLVFHLPLWITIITSPVLLNVLIYAWIAITVDKKARLIEESLPDALQLMASNLRAGITPDKAFLLSAREEFGPLKTEIDFVGKKITFGKNIGQALMEMAQRVRSKRLVRAVELINSGSESGGTLANLLEATARDLREQFLVDKKIKASITMYVMFIFSAAALISPILFGLSSFLIEILSSSFSQISIPQTSVASLPFHFSQVKLTTEFLSIFIVSFLTMNCLMASMLLGVIGKGKQKEGFRYFIPMVLFAIPLFFLARYMIKSVLRGLFGI